MDSAFPDEQAEVEPAVVIDEEDILAVVAPLCDACHAVAGWLRRMVRTAPNDEMTMRAILGMTEMLPPGRAGVKRDGENR